jgi:signal transduction histidine kinase
MRWMRDVGLGVKLSVLLLLVLGVLLLSTVLLLISNTQNLNEEVGAERISEEVNIIDRRLREFERELAVDVNFLSSSVTFFQAVGRRSSDNVTQIVTQAKEQLGFDDVDVVDGDGASLADVGMTGDEPEIHRLLLESMDNGANTVIVVESENGETSVRISAMSPVVSATGNTLGAIQISRFMDSDFLSELFFDPSGVFAGLIYDGQFLTRSTNVTPLPASTQMLRQNIEFDNSSLQRAISGETVVVEDLIATSDVPHAAAYLPVGTSTQASPVVMMVLFELDEIYSFQNTTLLNTISIFALLALLMIGVIYLALYHLALRPINNLRTIADKMIGGQYDQRIPVTGRDELGQLAFTFNEMASAVEQRETSLKAAREQAERSDQVKSAFLASMSHELRTPLNVVLNFTQFVIDGDTGPVNDVQVELLKEVVNSGKHLLSLINDVLDMSKIEAGSLKLFIEDDISVNKLLNSVIATGQGLLAGKSVELRTSIDPELPLIRADAQRILQIFLNLMSNACKFTDNGFIEVSAKLQDNSVVIAVSDTGPGIAPEDHELIFEAFKQTTVGLQHGGGTGLGLPIARNLAVAHGGELWLTSEVGKGTTFYVSLPVKSETLVPTLAF